MCLCDIVNAHLAKVVRKITRRSFVLISVKGSNVSSCYAPVLRVEARLLREAHQSIARMRSANGPSKQCIPFFTVMQSTINYNVCSQGSYVGHVGTASECKRITINRRSTHVCKNGTVTTRVTSCYRGRDGHSHEGLFPWGGRGRHIDKGGGNASFCYTCRFVNTMIMS
jgi:hypothetical protein